MSLADVMRPSDVESVDIQLRAVIGSRAPAVVQSIELLASSWREGHIAVRKAADALDSALADADIGLEHAARTALSTRLAGPGASSDLIAEIGTWLSIRDAAELTSGFAVEPRTLAALVAGRTCGSMVYYAWRIRRSRAGRERLRTCCGHGGALLAQTVPLTHTWIIQRSH